MKNSVELQQERASLITAQKTMVNLAKAEENRSLLLDQFQQQTKKNKSVSLLLEQ